MAWERKLGPDRALGPKTRCGGKGRFAPRAQTLAPDAGEVEKDKLPGGRQHPCRVVRGCPSWLGLNAVMDDHGVWASGHKAEEAHRLAPMRTCRSPGNRQWFGGYQQHVNEGQGSGHQHFQPLEVDPLPGTGEAVMPDLLKGAGQHVLQEPPDDFTPR